MFATSKSTALKRLPVLMNRNERAPVESRCPGHQYLVTDQLNPLSSHSAGA